MWKMLRTILSLVFLVGVAVSTLSVSADIKPSVAAQASSCHVWYQCPISQYFGQNEEHGVDLLTHHLTITAMAPGIVTYDRWVCWGGRWSECIQDITWRLDKPIRGETYAYVQIADSRVFVGQHVNVGTILGDSTTFIEFGLTPDWAYGISGWRWGIDPRFLL